MTMRNVRYALKPYIQTKNVIAADGGPAGMEAAGIAAMRGHRITLKKHTYLPLWLETEGRKAI